VPETTPMVIVERTAEVDHTVNVGEGKEAKVVRTKVTAQEKGIAVVADHGKLSKEG